MKPETAIEGHTLFKFFPKNPKSVFHTVFNTVSELLETFQCIEESALFTEENTSKSKGLGKTEFWRGDTDIVSSKTFGKKLFRQGICLLAAGFYT